MEWKKNTCVTVRIDDMGMDGEGIGKADGYTLFVKDAVIGDLVEARLLKCKKNYAFARMERVLEPSPYRVEPKCPVHRQCGGCQLQTLSYEKQLEFKQSKVKNDLLRIGGLREDLLDTVLEPIIGMEDPFHYRNKAQYPIGTDKDGRPIAGFYAGRTHDIIACTDCALGAKENEAVLKAVLQYMEEERIPAYDEKSGKGLIRHVLIRKGFTSGEIMVCLVINRKGKPGENSIFLPGQDGLIERLIQIKGMAGISVCLNPDLTNVIMGKEVFCIWGKDRIRDTIHVRDMEKEGYPRTGQELEFQISPLSFYQVNPVQTEKLYSLALEYAELTGKETVWDLYCGIGTISLFLAGRAGQVYGVEVVPQAIEDAKENARLNGIENAEFFVGKAEEILPEKFKEEGICADVIVVDPPRKGCDEECLRTILEMQPKRVVYVSCDPATLARDVRMLCDGGYEVKKVRAVDQFGMTGHVETVCLLSKLNIKQHIEVELTMDEMDLTAAEKKASYEEIKEYVLEKFGMKVSHLYIAQVKRKCGTIERENYNKSKSEDSRQPQCPPEKEAAIRAALEHFGMILQEAP